MPPVTIAALYHFMPLEDCAGLRIALLRRCAAVDVKGTLLLADEGINGTLAGSAQSIAEVIAMLRALPGCGALEAKYSSALSMPFHRLKVRMKKEIVTMGVAGIDPRKNRGAYVEARDWNALITAPGTLLIDARNDYEVAIGSFAGAQNPGTGSFRDFPAWFGTHRQSLEAAPRIAMFCTGGIRCEKASAFLKSQGFEEVHHLKGGILRYLEEIPARDSLWQGECFVFDQRVAVGPGLTPGSHTLCHACRMPVSAADRASPLYREGVACPACHDRRDAQDQARYAQRQKQMEIAALRGNTHIGAAQKG